MAEKHQGKLRAERLEVAWGVSQNISQIKGPKTKSISFPQDVPQANRYKWSQVGPPINGRKYRGFTGFCSPQ